ncbi:aspartyl protease family protein At5g10770-like isoform X1 [Juglans microcarpa x Juglans regia]|uniref:aspartyl protease family protein At5g10770-like isoform X1 n=2 Tax=Juglans microcarpa x Juglans regia TaxID=2249226 RepID=UPI001B7DCB27|nr:aspartyl protease family protein At5g10770-like isoform X1 [Juglans microcarpa x Juglans regia]
MRPIWFLVLYLLLATPPSVLAELHQETELRHKQPAVRLEIHHARGHGNSSFNATHPLSLSDLLSRDEERVMALQSRLVVSKDAGGTTSASSSKEDPAGQKSINIPLKAGLSIGSGNYLLKIGLGTPAKYYTLLLDTGSSFSWLQCQPCSVYCHNQVDPLFDPSQSKTYKKLTCGTSQCSLLTEATLNKPFCSASSNTCIYTASYGDSSYSIGYLSQDLLTFAPSQTLPLFVYGCGQDNQGLFGRTDGIVGLARDRLSLLGQLSSKYGYAFSYCLPEAFTASTGVGFLSLGESSLAASPPYKFTPMLTDSKNPSLYFLRLAAITVAGVPLRVGAFQYRVSTIIDSGTVITRLPTAVYTALQQAFVSIMSKRYAQAPAYSILDTCFKGSLKSLSSVPQIQFIFQGGADLTLKPSNILIEADKGIACLAFAGSSQIAIIGNHQQQTFKVAYDVTRSRIGFAAGGCH